MPLSDGTRLGPYQILSALGKGGMGEVYRAHDTRLDRDVAIKILPEAFAADADRVSRFQREATVLASLNHPHIAAIYGLEDAEGVKALVMELVEGEDLAQRLARGAVPLDEALPIAKQIAEALEAAHEQGIIHRDLKPANVRVRTDGTVKVLDFGLAKAFNPTGSPSANATTSPTISMHATQAGVLLGTAAYMPPEQARGKFVDKRADLWSFGCMFYEMLAGHRPFVGETMSDVLAKIIERDPDWHALPAKTPPSLRTLLRRCLEKDPRRRLDSAAVARLEIEEASTTPATDGIAVSDVNRDAPTARSALWASVAVLAALVSGLTTWTVTRPTPAPLPAVTRFAIALPPAQPLAFSINDRDVAISADGTRLAYTAGDQAQLMVRAFDQLDAAPVAGIENARAPFLSPDGRWIGLFDRLDEGLTTGPVVQRGALKKVSTSGGPLIVITPLTGASRGASWGPDDSIVFATSDTATGILRVPASGGAPEVLTTPDTAKGERDHYYPSWLPGSRGVVFTVTAGSVTDRQVAVLDLKTGQRKTVIRSGSQAEYVETGHLIYTDGGALWAVRFDLAMLEVVGDPVPVMDRVLTLGAADFTISRRGSLVYVPVGGGTSRSLVWVTRQGAEEPIAAPPRAYSTVRLSRDGKRVALQILDRIFAIWTWDFAREQLTRLTFDAIGSFGPLWTPDGRHIIFGSPRDTAPEVSNLYRLAIDGTGNDERLTTSAHQQRANAISPDGTSLVLEEQTPAKSYDFMLLPLDGTPRAEPLLQTPFDERNAAISPDGRWMAYESNESAQSQIYVRPFPNVADARHQISYGGGRTPVWDPNGHDLYFVNRTSIMAATVQLTPTFSTGKPIKLFDAPFILLDGRFIGTGTHRTFDVSPDGQRFLMIRQNAATGEHDAPPASMVVVQNWVEELKAKVAGK
jgi:serine/threonine protein kinase/Tol biopolymer transport system component